MKKFILVILSLLLFVPLAGVSQAASGKNHKSELIWCSMDPGKANPYVVRAYLYGKLTPKKFIVNKIRYKMTPRQSGWKNWLTLEDDKTGANLIYIDPIRDSRWHTVNLSSIELQRGKIYKLWGQTVSDAFLNYQRKYCSAPAIF